MTPRRISKIRVSHPWDDYFSNALGKVPSTIIY